MVEAGENTAHEDSYFGKLGTDRHGSLGGAAVGRPQTSFVSFGPVKRAKAGDVQWDPMRATVDVAGLEGVDVVIHLSGAGIADGRWTEERKQILRSSRIDTTRVLVDSLSRLKQKPRVLIVASAIGYYGSRGDEILTESSTNGTDFLASGMP